MESPEVFRLFGVQYGVASVEQLVAAGMSRAQIKRGRASGVFTMVLPTVVRLTGCEDSFASRSMALMFHCGPGTFVGGASAGRLLGLRRMPAEPVELTVPLYCRTRPPSWARFVSTSWIEPGRDYESRKDGLRVATPLRMLFGLAAHFGQQQFERAAEDAWHLGLVAPQDAAAYLAEIRRSGRTGVTRFAEWLEKTAVRKRPAQSGLEQDFIDLIHRAGLPEPVRQHPVVIADGTTLHVDLAWPDLRFGVEPGHSWWHGGDGGQRGDQHRDRCFDEVDWRVLRYDETSRRVFSGLVPQLVRIYHQRRARFPRANRYIREPTSS